MTRTDTGWAMQRERKQFLAELFAAPLADVPTMVDSTALLSPAEADHLKARADALLNERLAEQDKRLTDTFKTVNGQVTDAREEMKAIRDEAAELMEQADRGLLELPEYTKAYEKLIARLAHAQRRVNEAEHRVEWLTEREDDPIGAYRDFERKYPAVALTLGGPRRPADTAPRPSGRSGPTPQPEEPWDAEVWVPTNSES